MTKKEEKLIIDTLSEMSVQAVDLDCPKKYLEWSAKKEKELISELGLESEWNKAISAKGAETLRKQVEKEATNPIAKAFGMMLAEILASMGDEEDEEEEDDE
ncbi:MAG: hypothetical protein IIV27_00550 [Clostridia bacterium]|nr:hypothetical protein [Clostridia bacterium]